MHEKDLNLRPPPYQEGTLTRLSYRAKLFLIVSQPAYVATTGNSEVATDRTVVVDYVFNLHEFLSVVIVCYVPETGVEPANT